MVADLARSMATGLDRLLRTDLHPVLSLLGDGPLTVADILAAAPHRSTRQP
jgi:hypothetical protein